MRKVVTFSQTLYSPFPHALFYSFILLFFYSLIALFDPHFQQVFTTFQTSIPLTRALSSRNECVRVKIFSSQLSSKAIFLAGSKVVLPVLLALSAGSTTAQTVASTSSSTQATAEQSSSQQVEQTTSDEDAISPDIELSSSDGLVSIRGKIMSFDDNMVTVKTSYGVISVDRKGIDCIGIGCPLELLLQSTQ